MVNEPYPETIEAIYNETVRQYDLLINSLDGLNNKSIGIIAFNGTLLSLSSLSIVQIIKQTDTNLQIFLCIISLFYALIIISIIFAAVAYKVVTIQTINPQVLHEEYYTHEKKDVLDQLCSNIAEDITENKKHSKRKSNLINHSLMFSVIGVIFVCLSLIYGYSL